MTLSSCGTGTGSAHSDFASYVYVATMHVHSSGWSTTYTRLHVATMLFADTDCCTRTYVYTLHQLCTSQHVNYTTVLKYMKSHSYAKSTIDIQSILLSLQAALRALKTLENCPFLHRLPPNFIQGNLLGNVLKPISISSTEGLLFVQTFYTTPSANTKSQLHRSAAAEPVPVVHTAILRHMYM